MKLYQSAPSPFVRKVLVAAIELGLMDRIEMVKVQTTPISPDPKLVEANPVRKIPALETDDGLVLFDSRVITEYLDWLAGGAKLLPPPGEARWRVKRLEALADGLLDAAVLVRYETFLRPEDKRWSDWIESQTGKLRSALAALETEARGFGDRIDAGTIAAACACGYMDFRFADSNWRDDFPQLGAWYDTFKTRPSMTATPPDA
jgi:glutathione S-transferase